MSNRGKARTQPKRGKHLVVLEDNNPIVPLPGRNPTVPPIVAPLTQSLCQHTTSHAQLTGVIRDSLRELFQPIQEAAKRLRQAFENQRWAKHNKFVFEVNGGYLRLLHTTEDMPWTEELEAVFGGGSCKFKAWKRKKAQMAQQLSDYYGIDTDALDEHLQHY